MQTSEVNKLQRKNLLTRVVKHSSRTDWSKRLNPHLDREYIVPVLLNAIAVLNLLQEHAEGLKLDQILTFTGIPRTTAYRILRTYVATGHVHSIDSGRYFYTIH